MCPWLDTPLSAIARCMWQVQQVRQSARI
jgi:hypothetical protein